MRTRARRIEDAGCAGRTSVVFGLLRVCCTGGGLRCILCAALSASYSAAGVGPGAASAPPSPGAAASEAVRPSFAVGASSGPPAGPTLAAPSSSSPPAPSSPPAQAKNGSSPCRAPRTSLTRSGTLPGVGCVRIWSRRYASGGWATGGGQEWVAPVPPLGCLPMHRAGATRSSCSCGAAECSQAESGTAD